ncbi:MAG TPA: hypothetical protein VIV60_02345 [Polyangiaceae bacterium]
MPNTKKSEAKGGARATIDHDEIRAWVEEHGGSPATVKRTRRGDTAGIIRIDFPGYSGEDSLEPISWEEFFEKFEQSKLALLLQDRTASGKPSRFNKLVSRDAVETASPDGGSEDAPTPASAAKARRKAPQSKASRAKRVAKPQSRTTARGTIRGGSGVSRKGRDTSGRGTEARKPRDTSARSSGTKAQRSTSTSTQAGPAKRTKQSTRKKTTARRNGTAKKPASSALR